LLHFADYFFGCGSVLSGSGNHQSTHEHGRPEDKQNLAFWHGESHIYKERPQIVGAGGIFGYRFWAARLYTLGIAC
jgi:hypothetical protein